jgi:hypothetical protein
MAKEEWPDYQDVELCFELFRQKAQNGTATDVTDDDVKKASRAIETRATELQRKGPTRLNSVSDALCSLRH